MCPSALDGGLISQITGDATIHRGIYEDGRDSLRVYTIVGDLDACTSRLENLRSRRAVHVWRIKIPILPEYYSLISAGYMISFLREIGWRHARRVAFIISSP
jgi:hypothetical protein